MYMSRGHDTTGILYLGSGETDVRYVGEAGMSGVVERERSSSLSWDVEFELAEESRESSYNADDVLIIKFDRGRLLSTTELKAGKLCWSVSTFSLCILPDTFEQAMVMNNCSIVFKRS